jgi:hypothetical protein
VLWVLITAVRPSAVFWPLLGVNAVLVLLAAAPALSRGMHYRRMERNYEREAAVQARRMALTSPQSMRERADELDEIAKLRQLGTVQPVPQSEDDRVLDGLFSVTCQACKAPPAIACPMGIGIPVALVREKPVTFCHLVRMADAVEDGYVSYQHITARFGGRLPEVMKV